jgi:hypothetical protein
VALVIHDARFILLWERVIQEIRTLTNSNPSFWFQRILQVSRSRGCCLFMVMMMPLTDMVISPLRTYVYQQATWFLALVVGLRSFKAVLVLDAFIMQCVPSVL